MVFTHRVAGDARRLLVRLVRRVAVLVHREQDAAVHGLEAVARVGQGTRDDHAHRVIEIADRCISSVIENGMNFRRIIRLLGIVGQSENFLSESAHFL
jgi:hypothetical protein